ncbi:hypothetical protein Tco_1340796 [Tanacetum coccineum]
MILQDTIQVSLAEHKSREEQEARETVALSPGVIRKVRRLRLFRKKRKRLQRLRRWNQIIPVNVDDEEDEITDEVFELRRRAKGKNVEESRISPIPSPTRSPRNISTLVSLDTEKVQELTVTHPIPSSGSFAPKFMPRTSSDQLADNLHDVMMETLPSLVKEKVTEQVKKEVPAQIQNAIDNAIPSLVDASVRSYMLGHILHVHPVQVQSSSVPEQQHQLYLAMKADPLPFAVRTRDQDHPHDDAHPEGENSAKRQKTSEYEAYVSGGSSSGQDNVEEPGPCTLVSQDIMEEMSLTIDEAKLKKMADEMLRQRCTSGDEHQYHIDQMKNFLQSDIVWESRKEILVSPHPERDHT